MRAVVRSALVFAAMIGAVVAAQALRPSAEIEHAIPTPDFEQIIPTEFSAWVMADRTVGIVTPPDLQSNLNRLYSQVVNRTYVDAAGNRIMLSIAYGRDQSGDASQVHRPEFCYTAQGFSLGGVEDGVLPSPLGEIPVRRLVARSQGRVEPITYWVTVGEHLTLPGAGRKIAQIRYGVAGVVPDGLLFRVSSISEHSDTAFALQDRFVNDLLAAASSELRQKLIGSELKKL